jgi:hypothetical protein
MSAASRTIQATPGTRQVGPVLRALALLVALGAVLAYGPLAASRAQVATTGPAQVMHDHGWSTTTAAGPAPVVHDHGWSTTSDRAAIDAGRHRPQPRVVTADGSGSAGIVVKGSNGGGIVYTGIPYPAPGAANAVDTNGNAGSTRVRLAR